MQDEEEDDDDEESRANSFKKPKSNGGPLPGVSDINIKKKKKKKKKHESLEESPTNDEPPAPPDVTDDNDEDDVEEWAGIAGTSTNTTSSSSSLSPPPAGPSFMVTESLVGRLHPTGPITNMNATPTTISPPSSISSSQRPNGTSVAGPRQMPSIDVMINGDPQPDSSISPTSVIDAELTKRQRKRKKKQKKKELQASADGRPAQGTEGMDGKECVDCMTNYRPSLT